MASGKTRGLNYSLDGGAIAFFGAKGMKRGPSSWAINAFTDMIDCQVDPDSMLPVIRELVAADEAAGNGHRIAMLIMGPRQAVTFYLEGMITANHLNNTTEGAEYVDIPNVKFDSYTLTVRVVGDPEYSVATADEFGAVI